MNTVKQSLNRLPGSSLSLETRRFQSACSYLTDINTLTVSKAVLKKDLEKICPGLRIAETQAAVDSCNRLKYEVFTVELGQANKDCNHEKRTIEDSLDETGVILGVFDDKGEAIATCRINFEGHSDSPYNSLFQLTKLEKSHTIAVASKLAIKKEHRGSRVYRGFTNAIYHLTVRFHAERLVLGCQDNLMPLYRRLGFKAYGESKKLPAFGKIQPMVLELDSFSYLAKCRSPLVRVAEEFFLKSETLKVSQRNQRSIQ